ncbi:MAG: hypothetical protein ACREBJ_04645 [Nitrosotalea sp.]
MKQWKKGFRRRKGRSNMDKCKLLDLYIAPEEEEMEEIDWDDEI